MRRSENSAGRRLARPAGLAAAAAALALLAACSGGGAGGSNTSGGSGGPGMSGRAGSTAQPAASHVTITPANGIRNADPTAGITVTATSGTLKNVTVQTAGAPVSGALSDGGKVWHSQWALGVSQRYTVTATTSQWWHAPPRARSAR